MKWTSYATNCCRCGRKKLTAREEKTMTRKLQRRLDAYKHELNSRIGFDNRRRWTQRVLADIE